MIKLCDDSIARLDDNNFYCACSVIINYSNGKQKNLGGADVSHLDSIKLCLKRKVEERKRVQGLYILITLIYTLIYFLKSPVSKKSNKTVETTAKDFVSPHASNINNHF